MNLDHLHVHPVAVKCANCGVGYVAASSAALTAQGGHTHSSPMSFTPSERLDPSVVKEFAKPDPDADLNEWRKRHIG